MSSLPLVHFDALLDHNLLPRELSHGEFSYFGSGMSAEVSRMSNFAETPVTIEDVTFPSSEHAFQALLRVHPDHIKRFSVGGDLGYLESGIPLVFKASEVERKMKHYGAKRNGKPAMVGIVAKMAVKPDCAKRIGLRLTSPKEDVHSFEEMGDLFLKILRAKYAQNAPALEQLLRTRETHLVEFSRGAVREHKAGRCPLWTGQVHEGKLFGMNFQGELQMMIRASVREAAAPP